MLSIRTRGKAESIFCPTVNQLAMEKNPGQGDQALAAGRKNRCLQWQKGIWGEDDKIRTVFPNSKSQFTVDCEINLEDINLH